MATLAFTGLALAYGPMCRRAATLASAAGVVALLVGIYLY